MHSNNKLCSIVKVGGIVAMSFGRNRASSQTTSADKPSPALFVQNNLDRSLSITSGLTGPLRRAIEDRTQIEDPDTGELTSILHRIDRAEPLQDRHLRQLFHGFDLEKYGSSNDQYRQQVDHARQNTISVLADQAFKQALDSSSDSEDSFLHAGISVPKAFGHAVLRKNFEHFYETDRHMNGKEVTNYLTNKLIDSLDKPSGERLAFNLDHKQITAFDVPPYGSAEPPRNGYVLTPSLPAGVRHIGDDKMWELDMKDMDGHYVRLKEEPAKAFLRANEAFKQKHGRDIQVNSAYRSFEDQVKAYNKYHGKQAVAKPGKSRHNFGDAIDIQDVETAKPFMEQEGFVWPNYWRDKWHYDYKKQK